MVADDQLTWRREAFDIVQSHERIPGCDLYRAGDGEHARWLELRVRRAAPGAGALADPAADVVWAATLPADGPSGALLRQRRIADW